MSERYVDDESEYSFYHVIARVFPVAYCRRPMEGRIYPFGDEHKKEILEILKKVEKYFFLDLVSWCIMSNHVHLILRRRKDAGAGVKPKQLALRHKEFYGLAEAEDARGSKIRDLRTRLNDLSLFMKVFLLRTSKAYNRRMDREGPLWAPRFKSVVLEGGKSLSNCIEYVELNPVRAKMVKDARRYAWSSWGEMQAKGRHPRLTVLAESLRYAYGRSRERDSDAALLRHLSRQIEILSEMCNGLQARRGELSGEVLVELQLSKCSQWERLKRIRDGDEGLIGTGFGSLRPRETLLGA